MNLDLFNPDHVAELLAACESFPAYKVTSTPETGRIRSAAHKALSSPASAAELIRQLVERAGVRAIPANKAVVGPSATVIHDGFGGLVVEMSSATIPGAAHDCAIPGKRIASTVARLLALAPDAGAEAVLRALRGET